MPTEMQAPYLVEAPSVPHNREAEEGLIGSILINPEAYYDVIGIVEPEDFHIHRLGWAMETFAKMHDKQIRIDPVTFGETMNSRYQEFGGLAYTTALITNVTTSLHAVEYANIIKDAAIRRKLLASANEQAELAYDHSKDIMEVVGSAAASLEEAIKKTDNGAVEHVKGVVSRVYDETAKNSQIKDISQVSGVPTGLIDLDLILGGGMQDTNLIIIAGRPGQGKTAFLLNCAKVAGIDEKKSVAVFSMESSKEEMTRRLVAQIAGVNSQLIRTGRLLDEDWPKFTNAVSVLEHSNIYLDDTWELTPLQLRAKCKRLKMMHGLDLVIVDYIQLMSSRGRKENRTQEVGYFSRLLKILAGEIGVPVLAAAQLSRAVEQRSDKRPILSDLRE